MRRVFTDKEIKAIKNNITVLVDTREQKNQHILDFFNMKKIKCEVHKLDYGDYSCKIPANTIEGQTNDIYFDRDIVIERKACIDELASNFKNDGVRIKTELAHINKYNIKVYLLVEDPEFDDNIRNGNYRSEYRPQSLYARIKSMEVQYDTLVRPTEKKHMGSEIHNTLKYFVLGKFKHAGWINEEYRSELND